MRTRCHLGVLLVIATMVLRTALPGAEAQEATKPARVGLLDDFIAGPVMPEIHRAFRERLRDHGWVEGRNLVIEARYAERPEERREIAAEMERLKVDVVVACSPCAFWARPSGPAPIKGIPIVFAAVSDPVAAGMAASLARPGGNMTGLSYVGVELNAKRLQILKEALPGVTRVGILANKTHPLRDRMVRDVQTAAQPLRLALQIVDVATEAPASALDDAFEALTKGGAQAVLVLQGPHFFRERSRLAGLGLKHRLPGVFDLGPYAEAGGLIAYAPSLGDLYRRAAGYVDKILRGARPGDLPVEQPTKIDLVINVRTAKALGLAIPPSLMLRADQVIE